VKARRKIQGTNPSSPINFPFPDFKPLVEKKGVALRRRSHARQRANIYVLRVYVLLLRKIMFKFSRNINALLGLALILIYFAPPASYGQESESQRSLNRASQYFLGKEDEIMIKVNILGYIQKPGQYYIPRYTDLLSLISFAGGVQKGANLSNVQIMRAAKFSNGANGSDSAGTKHDIMTVNLKKYFETGETHYVPILESGDSVVIKQSPSDKWRNIFGFNSIVTVMTATATLIIALNR
jgi:hypothetical protein